MTPETLIAGEKVAAIFGRPVAGRRDRPGVENDLMGRNNV
jgi:hypothetical protein